MPQDHRDDGFRDLTARIKSGRDATAWDDLLQRTLPDLWRAAIQTLGDGDPPAVGRLVGSTLVAIAAHLDDFQPAEDDPSTYASFHDWWRSLMLAAQRELRPTPDPPEPKGWSSGSSREATSAPRFDASVPRGKGLSALVQGMANPPSDAERDRLLREILPSLWRAAIHMLGDAQPRRVALLVDETVAAILVHLGDATAANDDPATDSAFDLWWQGLMAHVASLLPERESPE